MVVKLELPGTVALIDAGQMIHVEGKLKEPECFVYEYAGCPPRK